MKKTSVCNWPSLPSLACRLCNKKFRKLFPFDQTHRHSQKENADYLKVFPVIGQLLQHSVTLVFSYRLQTQTTKYHAAPPQSLRSPTKEKYQKIKQHTQ